MTVFERADRIGGLLRYGIPDFKMEKHLIDFRMKQMEAEGVTFRPSINVGVDVDHRRSCAASSTPSSSPPAPPSRAICPIPGRELDGIHFAMDFLPQQNKVVAGDTVAEQITPTGKHVIILGGGDTGSDCLGTSNRQGATSVHQFELLPQPPDRRTADMPWPYWPMILRTSSSHEEGVVRDWSINTKRFSGENGVVKKLHGVRLEWETGRRWPTADGRDSLAASSSSRPTWCCWRWASSARNSAGPISDLDLELDERGNVVADDDYMSSVPAVCSPAATPAAASRWWCGRSGKAASARAESTST